jgi:hypothetical protein
MGLVETFDVNGVKVTYSTGKMEGAPVETTVETMRISPEKDVTCKPDGVAFRCDYELEHYEIPRTDPRFAGRIVPQPEPKPVKVDRPRSGTRHSI